MKRTLSKNQVMGIMSKIDMISFVILSIVEVVFERLVPRHEIPL